MGCRMIGAAGEMKAATVALYFMCYDFARVHQTFRVTPAIKAGIADHVWSIEEIVGLLRLRAEREHRRHVHDETNYGWG